MKYNLENPIIKHGLTELARGVGGYHRINHAVLYFNKHLDHKVYKTMTHNDVYALFKRALVKSAPLAKLNAKFHHDFKIHQKNRRKNSALKYKNKKSEKINNLENKIQKLQNELKSFKPIGIGLNISRQRFYLYASSTNNQPLPTYALDNRGVSVPLAPPNQFKYNYGNPGSIPNYNQNMNNFRQ